MLNLFRYWQAKLQSCNQSLELKCSVLDELKKMVLCYISQILYKWYVWWMEILCVLQLRKLTQVTCLKIYTKNSSKFRSKRSSYLRCAHIFVHSCETAADRRVVRPRGITANTTEQHACLVAKSFSCRLVQNKLYVCKE